MVKVRTQKLVCSTKLQNQQAPVEGAKGLAVPARAPDGLLGFMELIINGAARQLPAPLNIRELLRLLELKDDAVAVEVNRHIIRRDRWEATALQNNDRLEIVHFVGGG